MVSLDTSWTSPKEPVNFVARKIRQIDDRRQGGKTIGDVPAQTMSAGSLTSGGAYDCFNKPEPGRKG